MYARVMEQTGADPLPYGIEPNRAVLEAISALAAKKLGGSTIRFTGAG